MSGLTQQATAHNANAAPVKMDAPTVTPTTTNTELMVTGTAPHSHGHPIIGYEVNYRPTGDSTWNNKDVIGSTLSTTLTGLTFNQAYQVRVRAWNDWGMSLFWSDITTGTPGSLPAAPTNLTAAAGNMTLTVSWTAATGATSHELRYGETSGSGTWETATSPKTLTGLNNGTMYYVQVRGKNAAGEGTHAETTGTPLALPAAPTNLTAAAGNMMLTVDWTAAPGATSHEIAYVEGTSEPDNWGDTTTNTSHTLTGLTNGTLYTVRVRGKNTAGTGDYHETTGTPTAATTPAPTNVVAKPYLDGQLEVTWTPAENATKHQVRYGTTSGSGTWKDSTAGTPDLPHKITGLTNGTMYYVGVRAIKGLLKSEVVEDTATPMGAVTNASADAGNMKLTVTWTKAAGSTTTEARYYEEDETAPDNWTEVTSPYEITGLTNGTDYVVDLRGKNASGVSAQIKKVSGTPVAPPANAPAAPTNLEATASGDRQLKVTWTAAEGATSHQLRYGTSSGEGTWEPVGSPSTIIGLTGRTLYYIQVRGKNAAGDGPHAEITATPWGLPTPPENLTAKPDTDGTLRVTWTKDSQAASYELRYGTTSGSGSWTDIGDVDLHTLTGLTNGTMYYVEVRSINILGKSEPADEASATPMGVVTNASVAAAHEKLTVTWTKAAGATKTEAQYYEADETAPDNWVEVTSPYEITGLTNSTAYTVDLRGKNADGISKSVVSVTGTPVAPESPGAPTDLTADPGDQKLGVSWTAAEHATSHEIRYSTSPFSNPEGGWMATLGNTSHTLNDLTNGTLYYVQVRGKNVSGVGASAETTGTPAATPQLPAAPTDLTATAGDTQLTVSWTAAVGATSHELRYGTSSGDGTWETATSPHTITGLNNGTTYYVQVRGKNSAGEGTHAETTGTPTGNAPRQPPAVPTNLTATAGDTQLEVSWTAAVDADSHELRYGTSSGEGTWETATSPHTITGLNNGTMYYIQVRGTNSAGDGPHAETTGTPVAPLQPPAAPTNLTATAGDTQLEVS